MASVTVPGTGGTPITQTFDNQFNLALAQNIAAALAAAGANLDVVSIGGASPAVPNAPVDGKVHELIIAAGTTGSITIPASAGWDFLIDNSGGGATIFGSPNLSIMGACGSETIVDPKVIALGDSATTVNAAAVTLTGAGDNLAVCLFRNCDIDEDCTLPLRCVLAAGKGACEYP